MRLSVENDAGRWRGAGSQRRLSAQRSARSSSGSPFGWCRWLSVYAAFGGGHVFSELGIFFSKLAVVTFGGAYAVLGYMAQDAVVHYQWLEAGEMIDGLGLAETTPGPLILVTEFVGYLAAYQTCRRPGLGHGSCRCGDRAMGDLRAVLSSGFLQVRPIIDWINSQPRVKGALSAITAAVVGVILNLALWFGLHVFFLIRHIERGLRAAETLGARPGDARLAGRGSPGRGERLLFS